MYLVIGKVEKLANIESSTLFYGEIEEQKKTQKRRGFKWTQHGNACCVYTCCSKEWECVPSHQKNYYICAKFKKLLFPWPDFTEPKMGRFHSLGVWNTSWTYHTLAKRAPNLLGNRMICIFCKLQSQLKRTLEKECERMSEGISHEMIWKRRWNLQLVRRRSRPLKWSANL